MKTPIYMLIALCVAATGLIGVSGCADKAIYRQAAESGWNNWEKDHKKVVSDEEFSAMSEEDQAIHMSATKEAARKFERDEALRLLKD